MAGNKNSGRLPQARSHRDDAVLDLVDVENELAQIVRTCAHLARRGQVSLRLVHQARSSLATAQEMDDVRTAA